MLEKKLHSAQISPSRPVNHCPQRSKYSNAIPNFTQMEQTHGLILMLKWLLTLGLSGTLRDVYHKHASNYVPWHEWVGICLYPGSKQNLKAGLGEINLPPIHAVFRIRKTNYLLSHLTPSKFWHTDRLDKNFFFFSGIRYNSVARCSAQKSLFTY